MGQSTTESLRSLILTGDRQHQIGLRIMYVTMFLSSVGFSITLPMIWPYMQMINPSIQKGNIGLVVSIFSIGQLFGGMIFGLLINCMESFKNPLLFSLLLICIGNSLYAYVMVLAKDKAGEILLIFSRLLTGFGSGNVAIIRTYVTGFDLSPQKSTQVAIISISQVLGFIVGPSIQAAFVFIGYPGLVDTPGFKLNMFTASGFLGAITSLVNLAITVWLFKDRKPGNPGKSDQCSLYMLFKGYKLRSKAKKKTLGNSNTVSMISSLSNYQLEEIGENPQLHSGELKDAKDVVKEDYYEKISQRRESTEFVKDYVIIVIILLIYFSVGVIFTSFETILTPMIIDNFGWKREKATLISSICLTVTGLFGIIVSTILTFTTKMVSDRLHLVTGMVFCILSCLLIIPFWGPLPILQGDFTNGSRSTTSDHKDKSSDIGCPVKEQPWCATNSALHFSSLCISLGVFTVGFSVCNLFTTVIFSHLLGPGSQAIWMGYFTAVGSVSQITAPFYMASVYTLKGLSYSFGILAGFKTILLLLSLIFYKRLAVKG